MDKANILEKTKYYVEEVLAEDSSGHDWWHIYRVWKMARYLAEKEGADQFIVELAALLHDIDDWKLNQKNNDSDECIKAKNWLIGLGVDEKIIEKIIQIINGMSFKGANSEKFVMPSLEGKVVQDADRLDAIGAIGIARTFAYGGHKGRLLHDPSLKPVYHQSYEAYKNHRGTTLNHFYEKLLLLKDRMNTSTAKKIAEQRHVFMETFIKNFLNEWDAIS